MEKPTVFVVLKAGGIFAGAYSTLEDAKEGLKASRSDARERGDFSTEFQILQVFLNPEAPAFRDGFLYGFVSYHKVHEEGKREDNTLLRL
jgi:hypothetical protein